MRCIKTLPTIPRQPTNPTNGVAITTPIFLKNFVNQAWGIYLTELLELLHPFLWCPPIGSRLF
jgi:hypothetical protein